MLSAQILFGICISSHLISVLFIFKVYLKKRHHYLKNAIIIAHSLIPLFLCTTLLFAQCPNLHLPMNFFTCKPAKHFHAPCIHPSVCGRSFLFGRCGTEAQLKANKNSTNGIFVDINREDGYHLQRCRDFVRQFGEDAISMMRYTS